MSKPDPNDPFKLGEPIPAEDSQPKQSFVSAFKQALFGPAMSKEEAMFTLLDAAVRIDGRLDVDETAAIDALVARSKELTALQRRAPEKLVEMLRRVRDRLKDPEIGKQHWDAVYEACKALPNSWREAVFAQAVDLILADRVTTASEQKFIKLIAENLKIPAERAGEILHYLRIKNEHVEGVEPGTPKSIPERELTPEDREFEKAGVLSAVEAQYAIVKAAVWADRVKAAQEDAELQAIWRSRTLAACADGARRQVREKILRMAEIHTWDKLVEIACRELPAALRFSVYGQACDLIWADLTVNQLETKFLKSLRGLLQLDEAEVVKMLDVMKVKNAH